MSRKLKTTLIVLGGLVVVFIGVVALSLPSGSIETSEDGMHSVQLAMLSVPIESPDPLVEDPDQFLGVPHPAPAFDTDEFGENLSFVRTTADLPGLNSDEVLRAAYLGHDVSGEPYYIWHSGSPDLRQMIGQIVADWGSVGRLETSYGTEEVGPALWENDRSEHIAEHGLTTGSVSQSDEGVVLVAEWHALPEEVAAVVLYQGSEAIGWQRPVGGTAAFRLHFGNDQDPLAVNAELVALTQLGDVWDRHVMFGR